MPRRDKGADQEKHKKQYSEFHIDLLSLARTEAFIVRKALLNGVSYEGVKLHRCCPDRAPTNGTSLFIV
jgi:hypothetical protein